MKKSLFKNKVMAVAMASVLGFSVFAQMGAPVNAGDGNESSSSTTTTISLDKSKILKKINDIINSLPDDWVLTSGDSKGKKLVDKFDKLFYKLSYELLIEKIWIFYDNAPKNCNDCRQALSSEFCNYHLEFQKRLSEIRKLFIDYWESCHKLKSSIDDENYISPHCNKEYFKKLENDAQKYVKEYRKEFIDTAKNQNNSSSSSSSSNQK